MNSNALLLTALGVMFCSGCTTEQPLERLGASQASRRRLDFSKPPLVNPVLVQTDSQNATQAQGGIAGCSSSREGGMGFQCNHSMKTGDHLAAHDELCADELPAPQTADVSRRRLPQPNRPSAPMPSSASELGSGTTAAESMLASEFPSGLVP